MIITDIDKLRKPCREAKPEEIKGIIQQLEVELKQHSTGIGLAANQIGLDIKVAIIRIPDKEKIDLINPKIIEQSKEIVFYQESCLSLPDLKKPVITQRYKQITIENGFDRGKYVLYGMEGIACQHEIDHLNGLLITDRQAKPYARPNRKIGRNERCATCDVKYKRHENVEHGFVVKEE